MQIEGDANKPRRFRKEALASALASIAIVKLGAASVPRQHLSIVVKEGRKLSVAAGLRRLFTRPCLSLVPVADHLLPVVTEATVEEEEGVVAHES